MGGFAYIGLDLMEKYFGRFYGKVVFFAVINEHL